MSASSSENFGRRVFNTVLAVAPIIYLAYMAHCVNSILGGKKGGGNAELLSKNDEQNIAVTFADVAGLGAAKEELENLVHMIKNRQVYSSLGAQQPRGVLLYGPPGVGKTLLARAIAGEAGLPFIYCSGSDFVEV